MEGREKGRGTRGRGTNHFETGELEGPHCSPRPPKRDPCGCGARRCLLANHVQHLACSRAAAYLAPPTVRRCLMRGGGGCCPAREDRACWRAARSRARTSPHHHALHAWEAHNPPLLPRRWYRWVLKEISIIKSFYLLINMV